MHIYNHAFKMGIFLGFKMHLEQPIDTLYKNYKFSRLLVELPSILPNYSEYQFNDIR